MPKSQESWSEEEALLAKLLRQFWKNFAGIAADQRIQEEREQDEDEGDPSSNNDDKRSVHFHNRTDLWLRLKGTLGGKKQYGYSSSSSKVLAPGQSYTWNFMGESCLPWLSSLPLEVSGLLPDSYVAAINEEFSWRVSILALEGGGEEEEGDGMLSIGGKGLKRGAAQLELANLGEMGPGEEKAIDIRRRATSPLRLLCVTAILRSTRNCRKDERTMEELFAQVPGIPPIIRKELREGHRRLTRL